MSRPAPVNSSDSSGGEHLHWGKSPLAEPMVRDSADRQRPCDGRTSAPSFLHRRSQIPRRAFVRFDFRKSDELFRGEAQMKHAVDDGVRADGFVRAEAAERLASTGPAGAAISCVWLLVAGECRL